MPQAERWSRNKNMSTRDGEIHSRTQNNNNNLNVTAALGEWLWVRGEYSQ